MKYEKVKTQGKDVRIKVLGFILNFVLQAAFDWNRMTVDK